MWLRGKFALTIQVHLVLGLLVLAGLLAELVVGRVALSDPELREAVLELRLGRALAAALSGAALATGGAVVQGLFRNPLADPSILGTTAGAALGGRLALLFLQVAGAGAALPAELGLPLGCLAGALGALMLLLVIARRRDDLIVVLLTGFLLSSLFLSLGGFVTSLAQDRWELARAMMSFTLGDVSSASVARVVLVAPLVGAGVAGSWYWARPLDLLLTGEDEAVSLGLELRQLRRWAIVWVATLTAAAVSLGGNMGFVGLVVPHALRPFVGISHRRLIPASALGGAVFVLACDVLSRSTPTATEIPLGVITGLVGAPVFMALLVRSRREHLFGR